MFPKGQGVLCNDLSGIYIIKFGSYVCSGVRTTRHLKLVALQAGYVGCGCIMHPTQNHESGSFQLLLRVGTCTVRWAAGHAVAVIAAMTVGKDVSMLFPDVVNCMQTENLELKKLVYLYLINYAKTQPDLAIMAVNTFVKVRAQREMNLIAESLNWKLLLIACGGMACNYPTDDIVVCLLVTWNIAFDFVWVSWLCNVGQSFGRIRKTRTRWYGPLLCVQWAAFASTKSRSTYAIHFRKFFGCVPMQHNAHTAAIGLLICFFVSSDFLRNFNRMGSSCMKPLSGRSCSTCMWYFCTCPMNWWCGNRCLKCTSLFLTKSRISISLRMGTHPPDAYKLW